MKKLLKKLCILVPDDNICVENIINFRFQELPYFFLPSSRGIAFVLYNCDVLQQPNEFCRQTALFWLIFALSCFSGPFVQNKRNVSCARECFNYKSKGMHLSLSAAQVAGQILCNLRLARASTAETSQGGNKAMPHLPWQSALLSSCKTVMVLQSSMCIKATTLCMKCKCILVCSSAWKTARFSSNFTIRKTVPHQ